MAPTGTLDAPRPTPHAEAEWDPIAHVALHPTRPELEDIEILASVLANRELVALLCEALDHADAVFGDDATLLVEPFIDPDVEHAKIRAFLVVRTRLDLAAGNARMDALDEWWLDNCHRGSGLLSLAIDYV